MGKVVVADGAGEIARLKKAERLTRMMLPPHKPILGRRFGFARGAGRAI